MTGGAGNDTLNGEAGNDTLDGGADDDTLRGGAGNDILAGGFGTNIFQYVIGDGADTVNGANGTDTLDIQGTAGTNQLDVIFNGTSIDQFELGTVAGVETIVADLLGGADRLSYAGSTAAVEVNLTAGTASGFASIAGIENATGGSGADTLRGNGNAQVNNLAGGDGDDTYYVDNGDTITEAAGAGLDSVFTASAAFTLAGNVENLTYTGAGSFIGTGNGLANVIIGGTGANTLNGAGGDDTLIGGGVGDVLNGGANDDTLLGGGGNDTLNGDAGNDILVGGAGIDSMNGGGGNDLFEFTAGFGNDVISGFDSNPVGGQDLLDISAYGFDAAAFAANVLISGSATNTTIMIGADLIVLVGTNVNSVNQSDFLLV